MEIGQHCKSGFPPSEQTSRHSQQGTAWHVREESSPDTIQGAGGPLYFWKDRKRHYNHRKKDKLGERNCSEG